MASLMFMSFTDFITKFAKDHEINKYELIIISKDLVTSIQRRIPETNSTTYESKYQNIDFASNLYPLTSVMEFSYSSSKERFAEAYINQLDNSENFQDLCCIADLIVNDNKDVILLCSNIEYQQGFMQILSEHMFNMFRLESYSYEEFLEKDGIIEIGNKDEIKTYLDHKLGVLLGDDVVDYFFNRFTDDMEEQYKNLLMKKSIDDLVKLGNMKGIYVNKRKPKEEIVDHIFNSLFGDRYVL